MNTYDPSDSVVYVSMTRRDDPYASPVTTTGARRLPRGYANRALRTRLRGCAGQVSAGAGTDVT